MTSGAVGSAHGRVAVGHPVDVASGEFFAVDIDHELSGVVPLSLGRTFNTRFVRKPLLESIGSDVAPWLPFGRGWRPTWFAELRQVLDGFLYTRADGTEFSILDPRGDKSFAATGRIHSAGDGLELQRVDGARVRVVGYGRDRNENALVFERWSDRQYRLVAIERTREARIDIVYDLQGRPSRLVQRRERRSYELVYEGERVTRVALHLPDRTVRTAADYAYDARGRLVTVHDARGVAALYEYDDEDRIERDEKRGGSVYTVRYGRDGRCAYACGTNGYEERALRYDTTARKTWVTDSHGGVTLYEWNDRGQVIKSTSPTGEVTRAEFDELGRPKTEALATGELRSRTYDAVGRLIILASSFGWEQRRTYDEEHRPVVAEEWTALNADEPVRAKVMRYAYDADNNLASVQYEHLPPWSYAWTPFGELACATDPSGARRSWEHDELGQVARATNADGHTWWWTHDPRGRVITETDPLGHVRRVEHLDDESLNLRVHDPDGLVYQRHTSTDERLVRLVFPGGASRTTQLNSCGWPIAVWDEVGACTRLTWGTEPGELASIVDANGATYTFEYDAAHRVVRRVTFDGRLLLTEWAQGRVIATVDGAGQRTELKYDGRGHVVEQLRVDGKTTLEYNPRGLLTGVVSPEATLRFEHDAAGRIVAEDQDGVRLERTLDVMGRSVAYTTPFGPSTHFSWSPAGACMRVTHGDAEVRFERDALGREVGRQLGGAGRFEQSYDPVGRLMSQTFAGTGLPGGGSGDTMQRSFAYDARGFLLQIHDSLRGATALRHNDRGDLTAVLRERGWSDVAAYDGCQSRVFYAMTEQRAALAEAFEQAALMRAHGYDETPPDRLIERVPHVGQSQSYATGNRTVLLTRTDGTRTELRYDVNGRVVSKVRIRGPDRDEWRYAWDSRGRMVSMTTPNGAVWKYRYDATARRIEKQGPTGETWRYLWRGQDMVQTLHNGELVETYVHDPGGTCPLLRLDETGVRHILPDQNHSPSEEVGANGQVKWLARKGTWGEGWRHHGHAGGEPFLGQWYDAESGLHYNRFRYYDPDTGRYLSTDPIGLAGGLNLYMGISDPYSNFDRDGLSADDDGGPYIYRGVSANHPELPAAKEGRVVPGNVGGTVSADAHNLGGEAADSSFTSWTHNKNIALYHANKDGPGGVLLRVRPGAPPDGATWSWEWSPDEYGESEVLLKGKRQGDIEVLDPC